MILNDTISIDRRRLLLYPDILNNLIGRKNDVLKVVRE